MSELATEISGTGETITDVEFLGETFEDRRAALQQLDAYRVTVRQALMDTLEGMIGTPVAMTFRPSSAHMSEYRNSFPCYSMRDEERVPLVEIVTIQRVFSDEADLVVVKSESNPEDGHYIEWTVRTGNVIAIEPVAEKQS